MSDSGNGGKKISFGLGSALKPGFSKPKAIPSPLVVDQPHDDQQASTTKASLVIPLKESDKIVRPVQTPPQDLAKFEPKRYGLQVRKPKTISSTPPPTPAPSFLEEPNQHQRSSARRSEEELLKEDLNALPDHPDKRSYESVPVEEFGVALLKGMGWTGSMEKKTSTMNSTSKQRSERLGLGAKEGQPMTKRADYLGAKQPKSLSMQQAVHQQVKVSSRVSVKEGPHSGKTGEVIEIIDKGIASIKIGKHPLLLQIQTSKLSLLTDSSTFVDDDDEVRIDGAWPGAVVRIANRSVAGGKYYHRPAVIMDSHHGENGIVCSLKAESAVLHDISLTWLAPQIPSKLPCKVIILGGEHAGQLGILLQLLNNDHTGTVQLEDDHSVLLTLPLSSFTSVHL